MQHLQVLENNGVVRSEKVGRVRTCHLEPAGLRRAEEWLRQRRTTWENRLDRLGDYLAEEADHPTEGAAPHGQPAKLAPVIDPAGNTITFIENPSI